VKWLKYIAGALVALAGGGAVFWLLMVGPRMYDQEHIRAYQAEFPPMPEGVVPVEDPGTAIPSAEAAAGLACPVADTPANRERGRVYYQYYCVACHGEKGDGAGPVGQSYLPVPADLRSPKIQAYADGRLLRAILTGTGHEPVLEYNVNPEHRWYLVLYTRTFAPPAQGKP
jgi:mono/diheme cytochrome c family protein